MENELSTGTRLLNPAAAVGTGTEPPVFGCSHPKVVDGSMFCDGNCGVCGYRTEIKEIVLEQKFNGMNDIKTGVIVARFQPIHKGHLELIRQACDENKRVFVFVGSADKFNKRNPVPINLRVQLVEEALEELAKTYPAGILPAEVRVVPLDDLTDEDDNSHDWGFYLYTKIIKETENPNFTIYYSDGFEIITTWFPAFVLRNNVSLKLLARGATCSGISATKVRRMILDKDDDELKKWVPDCVFENRETIRKHIELANMVK